MLEKTYQNKWVAHWNTHRKPHDLRDSSRPWPHTRHPSRPYDVVLTRLRLNHTRLNSHMAAKKLLDSPLCTACDMNLEEDVQHFLLVCPGLNTQRQSLLSGLTTIGIVNPTLSQLLGASNLEPEIKIQMNHLVTRFVSESGRLKNL
ncbi:unnamed protein product [Meganyctiphanes norvegica]|uniref:Reverse transcriptase zinc-binding domain-containing protein n=2 Tax=Meganyctiphanes norvegica TaxID=48144 RepID=A0AAV2RJG6_MEGNR